MTESTTPDSQLNRAGRRLEARRLRKTGALLATVPAAFGTTALVLGATSSAVGAAGATLVVNTLNDGAADGCTAAPDGCTLRDALADAVDGDTIVFETGLTGTIHLTNTTLVVDYAIDIQGPGAYTGSSGIAIDANNNYRIFEVDLVGSGTDVTISGLTLRNGIADDGGAILDVDADLTINDAVITSNSATDDGGAVWVRDGSLTISGSTFTDNTARYDGGAIGIDTADSLSVTGSTFTDNTASYDDGGAIAVRSVDSTVTVTDSTFTGNTAPNTSEEPGGYGGAIYVGAHGSAFTITGSTFTDNSAGIDGGAVFDNEGPSITISGSTFTGNSVEYFDGGAVGANSDQVTIIGSTFTGNSTRDQGGALYVKNLDAVVAVTDSTFANNRATGGRYSAGDGASIATFNVASLTISGSSFIDNTATSDAGGVFVGGYESTFTEVTVTGSTFTGNVAVYYDGAAIAIDEAQSVSISFTTIAGNTAGDQGGGLYFDDVYGGVTIANSTISGNHAIQADGEYGSGDGDGGGIFVWWVYDGVDVTNSTISGNTAAGEGGAVFLSNFFADGSSYYTSGLRLTQTTVTANVGTTVGGIAIEDHNIEPRSAASGRSGDDRRSDRQHDARPLAERVHGAQVSDPSTVTLNGAIVALNSGADVGTTGSLVAKGSLFGTITGTTLTDQGGNLVGVDPKLGPLADNGGPTMTHALLDGSPAINAGPDPVADFSGNEYDQRGPGYPRVIGGRVDIGAFEAQATQIEPTFTG